ncbi:unnamed protein product [Sphagnum compactum]
METIYVRSLWRQWSETIVIAHLAISVAGVVILRNRSSIQLIMRTKRLMMRTTKQKTTIPTSPKVANKKYYPKHTTSSTRFVHSMTASSST